MAQSDSQMGKLDIGTDKHRSELISKKSKVITYHRSNSPIYNFYNHTHEQSGN